VLAVPGSPGTELLIAQGAAVVSSAEEVVSPRRTAAPRPSGEAAQVLGALDPSRPSDIDRVSALLGLPHRQVARALLALELDGLALPVPGGSYIRSVRAQAGRDC
jgi:predicted Rossmann fold nucleotide-binding protein DprA/Smf involved in DNA uptake